ncbi:MULTISPECIES: hypothetical protein, partial [Streptomyces]|uniref:hypothetical protein n=1 Tax=Streptomyces TaxID=1883 RepID=UPI001F36A8AA
SENRKGRVLGVGVLPPCTRLNVPLAKLSEDSQKVFHPKRPGPYGLLGLAFRDADGKAWVRLASGRLESLDGLSALAHEGAITWATERDVEIKMLPECGRAG